MNNDQQRQLRKIAILVATLDEPLAERLLADLPARESAAVQKIVEQLDDVDPTEYRAVVADFRQGVVERPPHQVEPPSRRLDGVELDESLLARMAAGETLTTEPSVSKVPDPWHSLSDSDAEPLVEMLSAEQPQTIAVVLSRLETRRAAELIGKLTPPLQAEVLTRLAELDPADEHTLQVVESQLAGWIQQQRQRRERMAAGHDLVQRILHSSPANQRGALLAQLGKRNPALAESLSVQSKGRSAVVTQSQLPASHPTVAPSTQGVSQPRFTPPTTPLALTRPQTAASERRLQPTPALGDSLGDPLNELEALDDQSLLRALRVADRQTVMLALAGASEGLMKRIVHGLPRRRANQFRKQVRTIGPTRLSDMLAAQRELVRCGRV